MAGATVVVRQRAECGDRRATQHEFATVEHVGDQAVYKTAYCNTRSMGDLGSNSLREEEKMSNVTAADGGVRLMFAFKVKINEKMHAEIVEQLEAKLAAGEIPDEEAETVETVEAVNEKAKILTE
jgi:lactose/raffinose/galactose permease